MCGGVQRGVESAFQEVSAISRAPDALVQSTLGDCRTAPRCALNVPDAVCGASCVLDGRHAPGCATSPKAYGRTAKQQHGAGTSSLNANGVDGDKRQHIWEGDLGAAEEGRDISVFRHRS